ncbi:hypothetical protein KHC23_00310 [Ancylobacter dichloromethanicus]|uniref:Secreted protein n=1 Tax=Ancylobacter dichloromethanicus TaxID=518825 RepID=A0A9W6JDN9_9HYPH|nr:hypothetical protein [Ancylobacter dichloromethanicus]MBS7552102.1 hypothetical protein [Ancylobacter dichloromethanicus]GLK73834.1 hypothetical protein GCM10017643_39520 [Ancylobacter dichloromethanicus]
MMTARLITLFRPCGLAALVAAALSLGGLAATPAAAQSGPIIINPPPGSGLSGLPYVPPPDAQDSGVPPTFQQYPLMDRIFGFGGAIFPGYVSPSGGRNDYERRGFLTGGGNGPVLFAAGSADSLCQMTQAPQVKVLSAPPGVKLHFTIGKFIATGVDGGSHRCLGKPVGGVLVTYKGRAPAGATATLRVSYPFKRISYTHVVSFPRK